MSLRAVKRCTASNAAGLRRCLRLTLPLFCCPLPSAFWLPASPPPSSPPPASPLAPPRHVGASPPRTWPLNLCAGLGGHVSGLVVVGSDTMSSDGGRRTTPVATPPPPPPVSSSLSFPTSPPLHRPCHPYVLVRFQQITLCLSPRCPPSGAARARRRASRRGVFSLCEHCLSDLSLPAGLDILPLLSRFSPCRHAALFVSMAVVRAATLGPPKPSDTTSASDPQWRRASHALFQVGGSVVGRPMTVSVADSFAAAVAYDFARFGAMTRPYSLGGRRCRYPGGRPPFWAPHPNVLGTLQGSGGRKVARHHQRRRSARAVGVLRYYALRWAGWPSC